MPEKAEKVHSFNGGREWMCLHILPHLRSLLAAGVMLLLSCTTDYMYGVGFFQNARAFYLAIVGTKPVIA